MTPRKDAYRLDADRGFRFCLAAGFLLALAIRLAWITWVQQPSEALYSDMGHYIFRAHEMFTGEPDPGDFYPSCMPFGAHYLYAFEMLFFGLNGYGPMAVVQAFIGALATPLAMLVARDAFRSPLGFVLVGIAAAVWHPQLVYVGYFSSELPYNTLLMASLVVWSRWVRTGNGAFLAGLVPALAFTVRPPMILTLLLGFAWLAARRPRLPWLGLRQVAALSIPVAAVVAYSATRHKLVTGEWGLISTTGVVTRFLADTDYRAIVTRQRAPHSKDRTIGIFPVARIGYDKDFVFEGWRCDGRVLEPARKAFLATKGPLYRPGLVRRNISYLVAGDRQFPEYIEASPPTRKRAALLRYWCRGVGYVLVPLAFLGMMTLVKLYNPTLELAALHVLTMLYAAAMHTGEIRFRVPYDLVLVLFAVALLLRTFRLEPEGERQDRWVSILWGAALASFVLVMAVPWPSSGWPG